MKKTALKMLTVLGVVALSATAMAATRTWDNDSTDGLWSTASNWSEDTKPVANDSVIINTGGTVTSDIGSWPGNLDVTLSGGSDIAQSGGALRFSGSSLSVGAGSTLSGGFWDLDDADITFDDGAAATMSFWEQKDYNKFTFNLSSNGFTALTPGTFLIGNGTMAGSISNATYIVDMVDYAGGAGTVTLMDFGSDAASMDNTKFQTATLTILNSNAYPNTTIVWNNSLEAIQLNVIDAVWDGGAGDGLWTSATNWAGDVAPAAGSIVHISNGDTVIGMNGNLPAGCTVNLTGNSTLTSTLGALRLNSSTINVASGSTLTSDVNKWFDLNNGTVNFEDGATNTVDNWEHKGSNTFGFTLSETGFTTLTPNFLRSGSSATWSDATYNIDISAYNRENGSTITLMDFNTSDDFGTFDPSANAPTVNITGHEGGTLLWDADNHKLILKVVVPLKGTVILLK